MLFPVFGSLCKTRIRSHAPRDPIAFVCFESQLPVTNQIATKTTSHREAQTNCFSISSNCHHSFLIFRFLPTIRFAFNPTWTREAHGNDLPIASRFIKSKETRLFSSLLHPSILSSDQFSSHSHSTHSTSTRDESRMRRTTTSRFPPHVHKSKQTRLPSLSSTHSLRPIKVSIHN